MVEERARYLHLPVSGDPPPFGFILNRDSSAPLGGDRNRPGQPALRTQKADIASVAGLERFDLKFSRLGWVSFLLSPGFSAHAGGGKFKLRRPVKRLDLCLAL